MLIKDVTLQGVNYGDALVQVGRYDTTKNLALSLVLSDTGEPLTKITVNLPQEPPREGYFWLKSWGENEGLLMTLALAGLIEFDGDKVRTVEMNDWGSLAIETKPRGELKEYIEAEMAKWTV